MRSYSYPPPSSGDTILHNSVLDSGVEEFLITELYQLSELHSSVCFESLASHFAHKKGQGSERPDAETVQYIIIRCLDHALGRYKPYRPASAIF